MKERFKRFLEREFRAIAPTRAAMEYRQEMLEKMLDRCQELRIKGISDEELIYDMCIDELGDFRKTLLRFENKTTKLNQDKRKAKLIAVLAVGFMLVLTCTYLIVSFAVPNVWAVSWLILVGGIFAGICTGAGFLTAAGFAKKKYLISRLAIVVIEVLTSVFIFLVLQLLTALPMAWITFLAMVIIVLGVDTILAVLTKSKTKFFELAAFMEVFAVMLYVIICIKNYAPWHPTWLLCVGGVFAIVVEIIVLVARKGAKEEKKEVEAGIDKDENFYTTWKD